MKKYINGGRLIKSIDNYFIPVKDLEKAKKYYGEILGLKIKFDFTEHGMVAYNVGEDEPAIILKDINKFPEMKPTIWFVVDNVKNEYEKLSKKGVKFLTAPFPINTGMAAEFEDDFGNRLGITDYNE